MEAEPVVASEPVFSMPSSVVANGSSSAASQARKVTAEQLAAVEDEELLDKMVLQLAAQIYTHTHRGSWHRQWVSPAVNLGDDGLRCLGRAVRVTVEGFFHSSCCFCL